MVRTGDMISLDVPGRSITLEVDEAELLAAVEGYGGGLEAQCGALRAALGAEGGFPPSARQLV